MWTLAAWLVRCESLLFDLWHNVETRATAIDFEEKQDVSRGFWYLPTRPSSIRRVLREVPIHDHQERTFIDFGSGKGRVLLLAAEYGYKKVIGIELRRPLHETAKRNLNTCKHFRSRVQIIDLFNIDALEYEFPSGPLVLYFFNPFGTAVLGRVLHNLQIVLQSSKQDVVLTMVNSEFDELMRSLPEFKLVERSPLRSIYRAQPL